MSDDARLTVRRAVSLSWLLTLGCIASPPASVEPPPPPTSPVVHEAPPPLPFVSVVAGESHTCALRSDGRVYCWGANDQGQVGDDQLQMQIRPTRVRGLEHVTGLAAAGDHSCAILEGGNVACWGSDEDGIFGRGPALGQSSAAPVTIELPAPAVELVICHDFACARHETGTVTCWGYVELFDPANPTAPPPPQSIVEPAHGRVPNLDDAVGLACGGEPACALRSGGEVLCWGPPELYDGYGDPPEPRPPWSAMRKEAIHVGDIGACFDDGCWATTGASAPKRFRIEEPASRLGAAELRALSREGGHACAAPAAGPLRCRGGYGADDWSAVVGFPATSVAVGDEHGCAIDPAGMVRCWGRNRFGQRGTGEWGEDVPEPVMLSGPDDVVALAASTRTSEGCLLLTTSEGRIFTWGGTKPVSSISPPFAAATTTLNAKEICATTTTGGVYCRGKDPAITGGDNHPWTDSKVPWRKVSFALPVDEIDAGGYHLCALDRLGAVWCWGDNAKGAIGDGTFMDRRAPVRVLDEAISIATGDAHSCALRRDGLVLCWGKGSHGRLGDGTATEHLVPTALAIDDAVDLAVGADTSCVVHRNGRVSCWGRALVGPGDELRPTPVAGITDAVEVTVGCTHACARSAAGRMQCWGTNTHGELGDPHFDHAKLPVTVEGLPPVDVIAAGCGITCAAPRGGRAYCWGAWGGYEAWPAFETQPRPIAPSRADLQLD